MVPTADDAPEERLFLVVTGSSAGGIDAVTEFVRGLPPDIKAAIVVAQHMAPTQSSNLAKILASVTPLTIVTVTDSARLEAGTIFVVPPNHDVDIVDSSAIVEIQARSGPKPSIDRLFATAATLYRDRLVAIILSGLGNDGQRGARHVKEAGGTVIIQEPRTAGFSSMPLSIPPTLVDLAVRPAAMGTIVARIISDGKPPDDAAEQKALAGLLAQVRERSAIDFTHYKLQTIMRRLARLRVESGSQSLAEYALFVQRNPESYQRLVNAFLIKVTEFFRDPALFDELRTSILPALMAEAARGSGELRIWSAGASTGEEAYSLAITCAEALVDEPGLSVRIFATDIDETAIAYARRGVYTRDAIRNVPPRLAERYFVPSGDDFEVSKAIRNMTVFGQHDLGQRAPFPRVDLCTCRNVLIYFTKELQTRALQLFAFALRDGGYLILGKAESTTPAAQHFRTINPTLKIFQRDGDRVLLPPTRLRENTAATLNYTPFSRLSTYPPPPRPQQRGRGETPSEASKLVDSFLMSSSVGVAIVDRRYDIITINAAARSMFQIHSVGIGEDLVHSAALSSDVLRSLVDRAFAGEVAGPAIIAVKDLLNGVDRSLTLTVYPDPGVAPQHCALICTDVTAFQTKAAELEQTNGSLNVTLTEQTDRNAWLSERLKMVLTANAELSDSNVELRTLNEQLLINTEEAASANEEIETLNEEMQATNEELETLNEELQATVEELNTTNDELQARTSDLERQAIARDQLFEATGDERAALIALLQSLGHIFAIVRNGDQVVHAPEEFDRELLVRVLRKPAQPEDFVTDRNNRRWRAEIHSLHERIDRTTIILFHAL